MLLVVVSSACQSDSATSSNLERDAAASLKVTPLDCEPDHVEFEGKCVRMSPIRFAQSRCKAREDVDQCVKLANDYMLGAEGFEYDLDRGQELIETACEIDVMHPGCKEYNNFERRALQQARTMGPELEEDRTRRCLEDKDAVSCFNMGYYLENLAASKDAERAKKFYALGCEAGSMGSCHREGAMSDFDRAFALNQKSCNAGVLRACHSLAWHYWRGLGVEADPEASAQLYSSTCRAGHVNACRDAGTLYLDGSRGFPQDKSRAIEHLKLACDGEVMESCKKLNAMPLITRLEFCQRRGDSCIYVPNMDK